ncbi:hypothetical protein CPB84DRAFT_1781778 [Gymnopilus junonius]|uniref:F-box domain-containing protein n=1 Tax=Gymnopilus junonius TaxID=109634 RepID=A0A9P5NLH3_GYMJU|nr:hypothetical protein CPB84DRAFT_1781778 [Gymnopilus junonius]
MPPKRNSSKSLLKTNVPTPFIANRLRLIQSKSNAPKPVIKAETSKRVRKTRILSLKLFFNLPLDIVFEICSQLEPVDLLSLSRVSKSFRSFLLDRSSVSIWRRVLDGFRGMPKCPVDLTEPQYISLLYDDFCMGCGSTRGNIRPDYVLRLRLCQGCYKLNVTSGHGLRRHCGPETQAVLSLIPASNFAEFGLLPFSSLKNDNKMTYFLPEAKLMVAELQVEKGRKENCPEEYERFISDQQAIASRMMNEGFMIRGWSDREDLKMETELLLYRRRERLENEMKRLGWEWRFFPRGENDPNKKMWDEIIDVPEELTTVECRETLVSLSFVYQSSKQRYLMELLLKRITSSYETYRLRQPLEVRQHLPPFMDVMYLQCLNTFLVSHWERAESCPEEDFVPLFQEIGRQTESFLENAKKELLECLEGFDDQDGTPSTEPKPTLEDIGKARVVFLCSCDDCVPVEDDKKSKAKAKDGSYQRILPYPDIVTHWVDKNDGLNWEFSVRDISCAPDIVCVAGDVLQALGLDRECSWAEAKASVGKGLVCECVHVRYRGVIEYDRMIHHVCSEREFYREATSYVLPENKEAASTEIIDGHRADRLATLIRRPRPADQKKRKPRQGEANYNYNAICRACYKLTKMSTLIEKGTENQHMRMMHGRAKAKGDMVGLEELIAQYGPTPPGWGKKSES